MDNKETQEIKETKDNKDINLNTSTTNPTNTSNNAFSNQAHNQHKAKAIFKNKVNEVNPNSNMSSSKDQNKNPANNYRVIHEITNDQSNSNINNNKLNQLSNMNLNNLSRNSMAPNINNNYSTNNIIQEEPELNLDSGKTLLMQKIKLRKKQRKRSEYSKQHNDYESSRFTTQNDTNINKNTNFDYSLYNDHYYNDNDTIVNNNDEFNDDDRRLTFCEKNIKLNLSNNNNYNSKNYNNYDSVFDKNDNVNNLHHNNISNYNVNGKNISSNVDNIDFNRPSLMSLKEESKNLLNNINNTNITNNEINKSNNATNTSLFSQNTQDNNTNSIFKRSNNKTPTYINSQTQNKKTDLKNNNLHTNNTLINDEDLIIDNNFNKKDNQDGFIGSIALSFINNDAKNLLKDNALFNDSMLDNLTTTTNVNNNVNNANIANSEANTSNILSSTTIKKLDSDIIASNNKINRKVSSNSISRNKELTYNNNISNTYNTNAQDNKLKINNNNDNNNNKVNNQINTFQNNIINNNDLNTSLYNNNHNNYFNSNTNINNLICNINNNNINNNNPNININITQQNPVQVPHINNTQINIKINSEVEREIKKKQKIDLFFNEKEKSFLQENKYNMSFHELYVKLIIDYFNYKNELRNKYKELEKNQLLDKLDNLNNNKNNVFNINNTHITNNDNDEAFDEVINFNTIMLNNFFDMSDKIPEIIDTKLVCYVLTYDYIKIDLFQEEVTFSIQGFINNREFEVKRTLEEFWHYRQLLLLNYPGLFVPKVDLTSLAVSSNKSFIKLRKILVQNFLDKISQIPILAGSKETLLFLDSRNTMYTELPFELFKRNLSSILESYIMYFPMFTNQSRQVIKAIELYEGVNINNINNNNNNNNNNFDNRHDIDVSISKENELNTKKDISHNSSRKESQASSLNTTANNNASLLSKSNIYYNNYNTITTKQNRKFTLSKNQSQNILFFYNHLINSKDFLEVVANFSTKAQNTVIEVNKEMEMFYQYIFEYDNSFISEIFPIKNKKEFNKNIVECKLTEHIYNTNFEDSYHALFEWVNAEILDVEACIDIIENVFKYDNLAKEKIIELKQKTNELDSLINPSFFRRMFIPKDYRKIQETVVELEELKKETSELVELTEMLYKILYFIIIPGFKKDKVINHYKLISYILDLEMNNIEKDTIIIELMNDHNNDLIKLMSEFESNKKDV